MKSLMRGEMRFKVTVTSERAYDVSSGALAEAGMIQYTPRFQDSEVTWKQGMARRLWNYLCQ